MHDILKIGDKIDISLVSLFKERYENEVDKVNKLNKDSETYISQIIDIHDNNYLDIAIPLDGSRLVPLDIGGVYELVFFAKKGLFKADAVVEGRGKEDNIFHAKVRIVTELVKIQRRRYFRLECTLDMGYREIESREVALMKLLEIEALESSKLEKVRNELSAYDRKWNDAVLTDLSGGGARFVASELLIRDTILKVRLKLELVNEYETIDIKSRVLYATRIPGQASKHEIRVEFLDISDRTRERVIKFIFDKQREIRKTSKL